MRDLCSRGTFAPKFYAPSALFFYHDGCRSANTGFHHPLKILHPIFYISNTVPTLQEGMNSPLRKLSASIVLFRSTRAVVAPPPPNEEPLVGKHSDFKIRIAMGFVGGAILLILFMVLWCCVRRPSPTVTSSHQLRENLESGAWPMRGRRKSSAARLADPVLLDEQFPSMPYGEWVASGQVFNHDGTNIALQVSTSSTS